MMINQKQLTGCINLISLKIRFFKSSICWALGYVSVYNEYTSDLHTTLKDKHYYTRGPVHLGYLSQTGTLL